MPNAKRQTPNALDAESLGGGGADQIGQGGGGDPDQVDRSDQDLEAAPSGAEAYLLPECDRLVDKDRIGLSGGQRGDPSPEIARDLLDLANGHHLDALVAGGPCQEPGIELGSGGQQGK